MNKLYNKKVFKWFLVSRLLLLLIILFCCLFSNTNVLDIYSYFDNEWYVEIANNGYSDGTVVFFPLIPLIIRYLGSVSLVIINIVCTYFTGLIIYKLSSI